MDKGLAQSQNKSSGSTPTKRSGDRGGSVGNLPTPARRRRLLHSFREFLGKEEIFWRDLLIRIVGVFDIEEARTSLRLLRLGMGDWEAEPDFRDHKEIHDQAILLCHKTLICFGDIARYRQLYSEATPKQASAAGGQQKVREGKTASGGVSEHDDKDINWTRAYEAYHQARLLVPDDGTFCQSFPVNH